MESKQVYTLDLNFRHLQGAIASYLIPHQHGAVLVECGPGSTIPALRDELKSHGFTISDVSDVLLTHIHLDHAGAAGWLARQGARIHVHEVGAPHMLDPEKLLSSAARIYGDEMEALWGEFIPVPEECLSIAYDNEVIEIDGLRFRALDTPGHAYHHLAYLFEDICFSGDIGGVRLFGGRHIRLPMPPPEFNLEVWRESVKRLQSEFDRGSFSRIAPTHFGVYEDADWHLKAVSHELDEVEKWILEVMPTDPSVDELRDEIVAWTRQRSISMGIDPQALKTYETANPTWMSAYGIQRYWRKVRNPQ
jgi:glyoxylase-like metal-dependent hydrolase (beta-lactamase superfamily II)